MTDFDASILGYVFADFRKATAISALFVGMDGLSAKQFVRFIGKTGSGKACERIEHFRVAVAPFANQRKAGGAASFERSTLHNAAFHGLWNFEDRRGHDQMFEE